MRIQNALSVDVEDYFQVAAFESQISRDDWSRYPVRVEANIDRILTAFDAAGHKATFFTLGWVCDRYPDLVKRIAAEGHEVASHGCLHQRVRDMRREEFREDVRSSKQKLEDVIGNPVRGYRAPSFSIGKDTPWAHDELAGAGYEYSSSVFPIRHDHYGVPDAPRFPYQPGTADILEIPMSTMPLFGKNLPCSGGGYFRLLPLWYSFRGIDRLNEVEEQPAVFYFHPWEVDPDQPRIDGASLKARFRHYVNLSRFESRLKKVLERYDWGRMDDVFMGTQ